MATPPLRVTSVMECAGWTFNFNHIYTPSAQEQKHGSFFKIGAKSGNKGILLGWDVRRVSIWLIWLFLWLTINCYCLYLCQSSSFVIIVFLEYSHYLKYWLLSIFIIIFWRVLLKKKQKKTWQSVRGFTGSFKKYFNPSSDWSTKTTRSD